MFRIRQISHPQTRTLQFICLTLTVELIARAQIICPKNESGLQWSVAPYEDIDNDQSNHVGKRWNIDCRFKGFIVNNASLFQERYKNSPWRKRIPNGSILIKIQQGFSLLSKNNSDVGNYYCKLCNKTKYVGRLVVDTSTQTPTVYPSVRKQIPWSSNVMYSCKVKGVFSMSWFRVAVDGSQILLKSEETSFWKDDFRYTQFRLDIQNFKANDEGLYMCLIRRPADNYTAEREIYLQVQRHNLPIHWYYTSFAKVQIEGHLMRFVLHVYPCHLPVIASLHVYESIKGIYWRRNFTADQPTALKLAKNSNYGVQLEMHVNPKGKLKDHLHISVSVQNLASNQLWKVMNQKFKIRTKCDREKCHWTRSTSISLQCSRYLDDLDEKLNATFKLTLKNRCKKIFNLQISDRVTHNSLFTADFENKTQARMQLKGFNQKNPATVQGRVKFAQFYLTLFINDGSTDQHRVKLFLNTPDIGLNGNFLIMEGDFNFNAKCLSRDTSNKDQTKTIAVVIIVLFIVGLLLFGAVWMYRRRRSRALADGFLLNSMEDETL